MRGSSRGRSRQEPATASLRTAPFASEGDIVYACEVARALPIVSGEKAAACVPQKRKTKLAKLPELRAFAPLFKALGDPTRLEMLALLGSTPGHSLCVCDIEAHIAALSQPTISHHLRLLREAGLVTAEKRGTWTYYTLVPEALGPLETVQRRLCASER